MDCGNERSGVVIAFRANERLLAEAEAVAAHEGISRSDVVRRALLRDLQSSLKDGNAKQDR
jgi:hypothetical protein